MTDIETINILPLNSNTTIENTQTTNNDSFINDSQIKLLKQYKDKSYIVSILAKKSFDYYSYIKSLINVPLILSSTSLAILNSADITAEQMKIPNIIINSITGLTLALIGNFKINERVSLYKNINTKITKLNHRLEEYDVEKYSTVTKEKYINLINEYESIIEQIEIPFPNKIKKQIYNKFKNTNLALPNSIIAYDDIDITELNSLVTKNNMNLMSADIV